jgi:hypothetical protein
MDNKDFRNACRIAIKRNVLTQEANGLAVGFFAQE